MASLATMDSYLQTLAKKICTQEVREPQKRKFGVPGSRLGDEHSAQEEEKKGKNLKKKSTVMVAPVSTFSQASPAKPADVKKPGSASQITPGARGEEGSGKGTSVAPGVTGSKSAPGTSFAMDFLRQRLHNKIQELSGKGSSKALSPAVLEKRQRRKYERERKKRRRKEIRMKEKLEKKATEEASTAVVSETQQVDSKAEVMFNRVEVCAEEELNKVKKKEKKAIKGNITPLTGKNYKQLLSRLETRKAKLEELRATDEEKAKELEAKMQWTNVLYKAEGVKIRDDEEKLKAALKRKEKRKAQRQRQWEKRTEQVVQRMEQRQEKRRKNLRQKKLAKIEKKKAKARKKGRILPEDLKKASPNSN